jgi:diguanylate cyclase (GGDEF)-like protein
MIDSLTGLLNRRAIEDVVRTELERRARYHGPLALGIIDADEFRDINRRYLHLGGDRVLISLAEALASSLRSVDTLGRFGGDEFLVLAPETNYEGACALAERIRTCVEQTSTLINHEPVDVTVSVGFGVVNGEQDVDFDQLYRLADQALIDAKAAGRNRSVVYPLP